MNNTTKIPSETKSEKAGKTAGQLSEKQMIAYECAGRMTEYLHSPAGCQALMAAAHRGKLDTDELRIVKNYVVHFASCSENPKNLWIEYLTDAFSSPDDVQLRVPNSGNYGRAEDALNLRSYFFKPTRSIKQRVMKKLNAHEK
jgi:hypothetical protein